MPTIEAYHQVLVERFGGVLKAGEHTANMGYCVLEFSNAYHGRSWSDSPEVARTFDYRPINDMPVSDYLRTEWMLHVLAAYDGSLDWPLERQQTVSERIVILTTQRIIANLAGLSEGAQQQCRDVGTLGEAWQAAIRVASATQAAGASEATIRVAQACRAALRAARPVAGPDQAKETAMRVEWAAVVALRAAQASEAAQASMLANEAQQIFITACKLWIEAASP